MRPAFQVWDHFGPWLLRTSLEATVLIVLLSIVQLVFKAKLSARWSYWLLLLVVVRLIWPLAVPSFASIFNFLRLEKMAVVTANVPQSTASSGWNHFPTSHHVEQPTHVTSQRNQAPVERGRELTASRPRESGTIAYRANAEIWHCAFVVWAFGCIGLAGSILFAALRMSGRLVRQRPSTDSATLNLLEDCKEVFRLHMPIALLASNRLRTPAVLGFLRPRIMLPAFVRAELSENELRMILLHELAHIKRWDIVWGWLMTVVQLLHWFNPVVWWVFARIRAERELACDETVLSRIDSGDRMAYGETLLKLLRLCDAPRPVPNLAAILEDKRQMKKRITMIANYKTETARPFLGWGLGFALFLLTFTGASGTMTLHASGHAPQFAWALNCGGEGDDLGWNITSDAAGNTFVVGSFSGVATFGTTNLTSRGGLDMFLMKVDASGHVLWVRQGGGPSDDEGKGVALDSNGNIYVTGYFTTNSTFDSVSIDAGSNRQHDLFLAKYNSAGDVVWVRYGGGTGADEGFAVTVNSGGTHIYVSGRIGAGTATFGNFSVAGNGGLEVLLIEYNNNGTISWINTAGSADNDEGRGVAVDGAGNVYQTGLFRGTATFGTTNLVSAGDRDAFAAKYDSAGNLMWVQQLGGSAFDEGREINLDQAGNVYVTGVFNGPATVSGTTLPNFSAVGDIFLLKFNNSGVLQWAQHAGGTQGDWGRGLVVDAYGNCFVSGFFGGSGYFGNLSVASAASGSDIFVAKYDPSGACRWVQSAGGTNDQQAYSITADSSGNFYITGYFNTYSVIGTNTLTSFGGQDVFVSKLNVEDPELTIELNGSNVNVHWPVSAFGFVLQTSPGIQSSLGWVFSTNSASITNGDYSVTAPTSGDVQLFRLKK